MTSNYLIKLFKSSSKSSWERTPSLTRIFKLIDFAEQITTTSYWKRRGWDLDSSQTSKKPLMVRYHHFRRTISMRNEFSKIAVETRMQDSQQCLSRWIIRRPRDSSSTGHSCHTTFDHRTSIWPVHSAIQSFHMKTPLRGKVGIHNYSSHSTSASQTQLWRWT